MGSGTRWKLSAVLAAVVLAGVLGVMWLNRQQHVEKPPTDEHAAVRYETLDQLQQALAQRAATAWGGGDDFNIVVTAYEVPIGTLMRQGRSVPVEYSACKPQDVPPKFGIPSLLQNYNVSREAAVDFGLDQDLLAKLGSLDANVKNASVLELSFKQPAIQVLSDGQIDSLLGNPACRQAIAGRPVLLVRGYIVGQRKFTLQNVKTNAFAGKVNQTAGFSVNPGSGASSLDISDDTDRGFLQIVSQVDVVPEVRGPASEGGNVAVEKPQAPVASNFTAAGTIYIQKDRADPTDRAGQVQQALRAAGLKVEQGIERIDTAKMPRRAQVRYFNAADKVRAEQVVTAVQAFFPNAKAARISVPAPAGQMEVWLPRSAS